MEDGVHPEVELGRFLTERTRFSQVAPLAGVLEYRRSGGEPLSVALLQGFVASQGDAWTLALGEVTQFLDRVLALREEAKEASQPASQPEAAKPAVPPEVDATGLSPGFLEIMRGFYPEMVALLGRRTGEFHLALCSRYDDAAFDPEPFALLYQRSVYQSMRSRAKKTLDLLRRNLSKVPPELLPDAESVLGREQEILAVLQKFTGHKFSAWKIRIHGDFHLGQVLYTGNDFVIIDFEGEPVKSLSERRIKQSPLRDVAGMMRSFYYAAHAVLKQRSQMRAEDVPFLEPWAEAWYRYNAGVFLASYEKTVAGSGLIPKEPEEAEIMLQTFMLDKAVYELGYELNNRPAWVSIPLRGILGLLNPEGARPKGEAA
jgi:maltose alpha-D-glucosyltransferase / alpha-amylase